MTKRRATIARRLVEAQHTAAMLTTFNEVDMTAVMELRERRKEAFKKQYGVGLGIASFFVKASVAALRAFPQTQRRDPGRRDRPQALLRHRHRRGRRRRPGRAGAARRRPDVVRRRSKLAIRDFAEARAQDGTLTLDDLTGGTFTITNGGVFGSLLSTPILNPPQVGHPRPAQDPGSPDRRQRPGRDPADDVRRPQPTITASSTAARRCSSWSRSRNTSRTRGSCCSKANAITDPCLVHCRGVVHRRCRGRGQRPGRTIRRATIRRRPAGAAGSEEPARRRHQESSGLASKLITPGTSPRSRSPPTSSPSTTPAGRAMAACSTARWSAASRRRFRSTARSPAGKSASS